MLSAVEVFNLGPEERKELIYSRSNVVAEDDEIEVSRKLSGVINSFAEGYFDLLNESDQSQANGSVLINENLSSAISSEIAAFKPLAVEELRRSTPNREQIVAAAKNIYELAGAVKLAGANKATRNLSTTMGLLWERIANISPHAINPEAEFNLKIKGVDLISRNIHNRNIEYQQLKTKRDTLTGSQKGRSVSELEIHDHPIFCTCFALGPWTFNDPNIPRVSGTEFWSRIGIDYSIFESLVKTLILELEDVFISL